jgi:hypothetical protein
MDVWALFASFMVSTIGFAYLTYGKKSSQLGFALAGIVLMIYPYFVSEIWQIVVIGAVLMALPFYWFNL